MTALPEPTPDPEIKRICEAVGQQHLRVHDGITLMRDRMQALLDGCTDINKMSVLAVRLTEVNDPASEGLLLNEEQLQNLWTAPQTSEETHPDLHMSFLVLSCFQLTSMGVARDGAKAMTQALDQMLPEQTNRAL